ncbi:MAG: SDR family NAD(P)-dependent oxidoreductase [Myxococcota bacterium]
MTQPSQAADPKNPAPLSTPISPRLRDRIAIVTGGASGIGRASALRLAAEGASVCIGDLNEAGAQEVATEIEAAGGRAIAVATDVSAEADMQRLIARTVEAFGALDVLHNNAAALGKATVGTDFMVDELDVAVWDRTMAVNLRSVMLGCKYAVPEMIKRGGGSIINTSTGSSVHGDIVGPAYATSKAAVNTLTQYVATQYGKQGIRCNAILPGLIMTPAVEVGLDDSTTSRILDHHLTRSVGHPDDIAAMVAYLASDESRYVTAQLLRVDGGITNHSPMVADTRRAIGLPGSVSE